MNIIGIDPGLHGGIATLVSDGSHYSVTAVPMPTIATTRGKKTTNALNLPAIVAVLRRVNVLPTITIAFIEKVHTMPKQGVVSAGKFMEGYGQIQGILAALGIGYELVTPQAWMKVVLSGYSKGGHGKKPSIQYVTQKYPDLNVMASERSRKPHDGMCDAVCIAEYGAIGMPGHTFEKEKER